MGQLIEGVWSGRHSPPNKGHNSNECPVCCKPLWTLTVSTTLALKDKKLQGYTGHHGVSTFS